MTAEDTLFAIDLAGFTVVVKDGRPSLQCPAGKRPNAALLAALKEHRAGVLALLGVEAPAPPPESRLSQIVTTEAACDPEVCGTCDAWVHPELGVEHIARLCFHTHCEFKGGRRG